MSSFVLTPDILSRAWTGSELDVPVSELLERGRAWQLVGYAFVPLTVVVRIGYSAVCLAVGSVAAGWDVAFSDLFRAGVLAESVWAVAAVAHLACVLFVVDVRSPADYASFYPLSAIQLVDVDTSEMWLTYLLKSLNLFEVTYVIALTTSVRYVVDTPPNNLGWIVSCSYGCGLALLVAAVTFALMAVS